MTDPEHEHLARENAYLKLRCAELQDANGDLQSQVLRLQQQLERLNEGRNRPRPPDPLSGGQ